MKKIFIIITSAILLTNAEVLVTEDMIYGSVIDAIKRIPSSISNLGNHIYKEEIKKERNMWWYFKKNNKIKIKLKEKNIDYYTILKQGMYPRKVYDNSRRAEMKKYAILTALAKQNNIKIEETINIVKEERKKN
jgi:hypothetical protein